MPAGGLCRPRWRRSSGPGRPPAAEPSSSRRQAAWRAPLRSIPWSTRAARACARRNRRSEFNPTVPRKFRNAGVCWLTTTGNISARRVTLKSRTTVYRKSSVAWGGWPMSRAMDADASTIDTTSNGLPSGPMAGRRRRPRCRRLASKLWSPHGCGRVSAGIAWSKIQQKRIIRRGSEPPGVRLCPRLGFDAGWTSGRGRLTNIRVVIGAQGSGKTKQPRNFLQCAGGRGGVGSQHANRTMLVLRASFCATVSRASRRPGP